MRKREVKAHDKQYLKTESADVIPIDYSKNHNPDIS